MKIAIEISFSSNSGMSLDVAKPVFHAYSIAERAQRGVAA